MASLTIRSPAEMQDLGSRLGKVASPGLVVGLIGDLGAGKTTFVRGVANGAEVSPEQMVASPTFVLIHEYEGRIPVYHFDTYRLANPEAFADLGAAEYFDGDGICLVEWADRVRKILPLDRIDVEIEHAGEQLRRVAVLANGPVSQEVLNRWLGE